MRKLTAKSMKALRALHIVGASLWTGSLACIAMALVGPMGGSAEGAHALIDLLLEVDIWLIIPGVAIVTCGAIIYGVASNWGFVKHRWVLSKWILFFAAVIPASILFIPTCESMQLVLVELGDGALGSSEFQEGRLLLLCLSIYLLALSVLMVLISTVKPWGKCRAKKGVRTSNPTSPN